MTTAHLIHGFNVKDGGEGTVGQFADYFRAAGYTINRYSYGWTHLLRLRFKNERAVKELTEIVEDGDLLVLHSNAALIGWQLVRKLVRRGIYPSGVICIQPALRRDTRWPPGVPILCLYNKSDRVVSMGRIWGRFASVARPWRSRHGWGAAGRHGFTLPSPYMTKWDTALGPVPAKGHSKIFKMPRPLYWGPKLAQWAVQRLECHATRKAKHV